MGKQQKRNVLHDAAGKKIQHPADALRKQSKKKWLERKAQRRKQNFEGNMLNKPPELIQAEILEYKMMEEAGKLTKWKKDRMSRTSTFFNKLKDQVVERDHKRKEAEKADYLHVEFEELKVHRKSSIFYHPVDNPYGAPPTGQTVAYRHPDGSVRREPPPVGSVPGTVGETGGGSAASSSDSGDDSEACSDGEEDSDEERPPPLPDVPPPGSKAPPASSSAGLPPMLAGLSSGLPLGPGLPPLPPGPPPNLQLGACFGPAPQLLSGLPPGVAPAPSLPPLPPGPPPGLVAGQALPPGLPPSFPLGMQLGLGQIPAGVGSCPPLPPGLPPGFASLGPGQQAATTMAAPLPASMPSLGLPEFLAGPQVAQPLSQTDFAAELQSLGFLTAGGSSVPFGSPINQKTPKLPLATPPQVSAPASIAATALGQPPPASVDLQSPPKMPAVAEGRRAPPPPPKTSAVAEGRKAPPPPPKRPSAGAGPASLPKVSSAATLFTPTNLRTKKVSQVAGGVMQVSSSLSQDARKRVLLTETPRMQERVDLDEAYDELMKELA
mmetsp:Transcript_14227/g.28183  ORF Transcript_14227/g.28183 Transcript_14227/m.28183 type:complete len:550 (+) Transcript_14227:42-1691(+)